MHSKLRFQTYLHIKPYKSYCFPYIIWICNIIEKKNISIFPAENASCFCCHIPEAPLIGSLFTFHCGSCPYMMGKWRGSISIQRCLKVEKCWKCCFSSFSRNKFRSHSIHWHVTQHVTSNLRPAPDVIMYFADMQSLGSKVGDARDQLGGSDGRTVQLENGTHTQIYIYIHICIHINRYIYI